jgi:hypothetical protein
VELEPRGAAVAEKVTLVHGPKCIFNFAHIPSTRAIMHSHLALTTFLIFQLKLGRAYCVGYLGKGGAVPFPC